MANPVTRKLPDKICLIKKKESNRDLSSWCYKKQLENIVPNSIHVSNQIQAWKWHLNGSKNLLEQKGFYTLFRPPIQLFKSILDHDVKHNKNKKSDGNLNKKNIKGPGHREPSRAFQHGASASQSLALYTRINAYSNYRLGKADRKLLAQSVACLANLRSQSETDSQRTTPRKSITNPSKIIRRKKGEDKAVENKELVEKPKVTLGARPKDSKAKLKSETVELVLKKRGKADKKATMPIEEKGREKLPISVLNLAIDIIPPPQFTSIYDNYR